MTENRYARTEIVCVETGTIYESAAAAAHAIGCGRAAMSNHLSGRYPHVRGKHFKRVSDELELVGEPTTEEPGQ